MTRDYKFYDKRKIGKYAIMLLVLMGASYLTMGWVFVAFIAVMLHSIMQKKPETLLFIILASSCFMLTNNNLVFKGIVFVACMKVLLLVAAVILSIQIPGLKSSKFLSPLLSIFPYLLFMAIISQMGWNPLISNLKLFLFSMVFLAYYGCSLKFINGSSGTEIMRNMILGVAVVYIIGSALLIPLPQIGYMSGKEALLNPNLVSLFCGMTNHSQTLGPLVAIFGVLIYADMAFSLQRPDGFYLLLLACCPVLIYITSSRTAMASFIAGMAFVTMCATCDTGIARGWRRSIVSFVTMVCFAVTVAIAFTPQLRNKIAKFAVKYDKEDKVELSTASIWKSREGKLEGALYNWRKKPLIGNGFQVSLEMSGLQIQDFKQILSAPVEKSTWTHAILEEGGIIGMILFVLFLLISMGLLMKREGYIAASLLLTFVLSNMGEFTIFSMSADGGLYWLLVFIGAIMDHRRVLASQNFMIINR